MLLPTTGGESADTFMTHVMCCYVKIDISAGTGTGQLNGTHCVHNVELNTCLTHKVNRVQA